MSTPESSIESVQPPETSGVMSAIFDIETKVDGENPLLGNVIRLVSENYGTVETYYPSDDPRAQRAIDKAREIRSLELDVLNAPRMYGDGARKYILDKSKEIGRDPRTSVALFAGSNILLYAGFEDEKFSPFDDPGYMMSPRLNFVVGNKELLTADDALAVGAVAGLFSIIEHRQRETRYALTKSKHDWVERHPETGDASFKTIPFSAYATALNGLMREIVPKESLDPFLQAPVKQLEDGSSSVSVNLY